LPIDLPDELDELEEQVREVGKLTPREYARLRGVAPQMVYYYIRTKRLELEYCVCGRRVVDVVKADAVFSAKKKDRG
jgi:hypothetical protein